MRTSTRWLLAGGLLLATQARSADAQSLDFQFYRMRVEPIFLKLRDVNGPGGTCFMCHTHVNTRFRLQPVSPGTLSWSEDQSRRNFEAVTRLVMPGDPLKSRLLLHPLAPEAGGDAIHAGGKHWQSQDDPEWQTLAAWVRTGSAAAGATSSSTPGPVLDFEVFQTRVQPLSPGSTTWNEAESRRNFEAIQRLVVPGDPLSSRLLMMPLATEAGGDPFHPGGKRWPSQKDAEWQSLASWVRGQAPGGPPR